MKHFLSSLLFFALMTILVSCTANSGKSSQTERCFDAETVTNVMDAVFVPYDPDESYRHKAEVFRRLVANGNVDSIKQMTDFPLMINRYVIIENEDEFAAMYDNIFTKEVCDSILYGTLNFQYNIGIVTFASSAVVSENGKLIAVGECSNFIKNLTRKRISLEKQGLHKSIRNYVRCRHYMETEHYRVRIDEMTDTLRFTLWNINDPIDSKPRVNLLGYEEDSGSYGYITYYFYGKNTAYWIRMGCYMCGRDYNNEIGQYPVTQYNEDYECDFDIEHPIMDEAIKVCQPDNRTFLY